MDTGGFQGRVEGQGGTQDELRFEAIAGMDFEEVVEGYCYAASANESVLFSSEHYLERMKVRSSGERGNKSGS